MDILSLFVFNPEDLFKLLIAVFTGAVIGFEREYHSKSAGLRTMILICLGSTLFTLISIKIGKDAARIAANIVTGIGFLGGGIIFKGNNKVSGITTAAAVWVTAALGMCVASGMYLTGLVAMVLVIVTLYGLVFLEKAINKRNQIRSYRIVCTFRQKTLRQYEDLFDEFRLESQRGLQTRIGDKISGNWLLKGTEKNHEKLIKRLLNDNEVLEFDF